MKRNRQLDVLRGIAALLAVGGHRPYFHLWSRFGGRGVDLFFVLSGFLISGLLFEEYMTTGSISLKRFFIRRGFKIYPAYYFFVLLLLPFTFHKLTVADFVFMQAYWPYHWGHGWSISIEEHFYILLPLLLLLSLKIGPRNNFRWIPIAFPFVLIGCLALRMTVPFERQGDLIHTHYRLDGLCAGVALGWFYHFDRKRFDSWRGKWFLILGLFLVAPVAIWHVSSSWWTYTIGQTSLLLGFALIILWGVHSSALGQLTWLGKLGFYSYSVYLWHWPIALIFQQFRNTFLLFIAYLATSFAVGICAAKVIELPLLRIRDRYFPAPRHREEKQPAMRCKPPDSSLYLAGAASASMDEEEIKVSN